MKSFPIFAAGVVAVFLIAGCAPSQYTQYHRAHMRRPDTLDQMKVQDIITLSKAGVSDSIIISEMDASDSWFHLKPQDIIDLKNAGVSDNVIKAMMAPPPKSAAAAGDSSTVRYVYPPPYWWYDGFYPYWYYPSFSIRVGRYPHFYGGFHMRRFR